MVQEVQTHCGLHHAVEPSGNTLEELAQSIEDFKAALALPVLTLENIPKSSPALAKQKNGKTISHEQLRLDLRTKSRHTMPSGCCKAASLSCPAQAA